MGQRPNAHGNCTVKKDEEWVQVGDVVAWLNEKDCGGLITLNVQKLVELGLLNADMEKAKVNFRVWTG